MVLRWFGFLTVMAIGSLTGCSSGPPPSSQPGEVDDALTAPVNQTPIASIPASPASGVARWDVYASDRKTVRIVGRDAEQRLKSAVTVAGSPGQDGFLGALAFAKEKGSPLTWDQVVRAYVADADAFAAAHPPETVSTETHPAGFDPNPDDDPLVTDKTQLIERYCQSLTDAFRKALNPQGGQFPGQFPSQPGWMFAGTDPACLDANGNGEVWSGSLASYVEANGCGDEQTKLEVNHYLVGTPLGPLGEYWTCPTRMPPT
jgi:hypothetical protein